MWFGDFEICAIRALFATKTRKSDTKAKFVLFKIQNKDSDQYQCHVAEHRRSNGELSRYFFIMPK